jgi:hypothetical protein
MRVRDRQQFPRGSFQPAIPRSRLTPGTVAVSAGIECRHLLLTRIALSDMGAELPRLTGADIPECLDLLPVQRMAPAYKELLSVLSEDIGDFRPMFVHFCRPSSFDFQIGFTFRASNGQGAA